MTPKSFMLFIFLLLFTNTFYAQNNSLAALKKDVLLKELGGYVKEDQTKKKKHGIGNALLTLYQKRISVLISADCLYSLSCSRFSREAINKCGFLPGILLTADRLTRCSFFCGKDIPESKFNEDGLALDNP